MSLRAKPPIECNITKDDSLKLWHERLGHVNLKAIKEANKNNAMVGLNLTDKDDFFCEACQFGKQTRKSHNEVVRKVNPYKPAEKIHSDVADPMIHSPSGSRFFVIFKDDCTGYQKVYFMSNKSEVLTALIEKQTGNKIKIFKSDNGTEYTNNDFQQLLQEEGIIHERSAPYTAQQNGSSEREIRTVIESDRSMMYHKKVPTELWAEAVNTAVYILNRTPIN